MPPKLQYYSGRLVQLMTKHENSVLFTTLFVIALMIRLPGVDYGLQAGAPFFVHWPDEGNVLRWTLALGMGEFSPTGGNFFYFTSLIILGLKFVVGFLAGWYFRSGWIQTGILCRSTQSLSSRTTLGCLSFLTLCGHVVSCRQKILQPSCWNSGCSLTYAKLQSLLLRSRIQT